MQNVFMILGGSHAQLEAIQAVKKLGMKVLVLDMDPNAIGFKYADYFEVVSTTDFENVKKVAEKYRISGSMTLSSDTAVPTVCYVNEKLGLPNQGVGIGELVTDKSLMRKAFSNHHISSPNFIVLNHDQTILEILPNVERMLRNRDLIVKPSESSGSRGVSKIESVHQLEPAINLAREFTRNNNVVIEEFIEGVEIGAQCFSINGKMEMCFVHNDLSANMVPVGHSYPSFLSNEVLERVKNECDNALSSLGIMNGPSNIDIIIDKEGCPFFIEIGARIGATKLPQITKYHSGIDLIECSIQLASGQDITIPIQTNIPVAVEMLCFEKEHDITYKFEEIESLIHTYDPIEYKVNLKNGQEVKGIKSSADVYGFVICSGSSAQNAEQKCRELSESIKNKVVSINSELV
ncbi:ATP-grasp domain-containing protein [Chengkuizengella sp. SCS-71B]|uniref:ATP-grasp domain-containing protein n=1 Tax=Chengkuizengella sp. SCS-71B TaxID=3115290 RepID=UPI0032C21A06